MDSLIESSNVARRAEDQNASRMQEAQRRQATVELAKRKQKLLQEAQRCIEKKFIAAAVHIGWADDDFFNFRKWTSHPPQPPFPQYAIDGLPSFIAIYCSVEGLAHDGGLKLRCRLCDHVVPRNDSALVWDWTWLARWVPNGCPRCHALAPQDQT